MKAPFNETKEFTLTIKRLDDSAIIPQYAHQGDAGLDLFSVEETEIEVGEVKSIRTGIAVELPTGTEGQIRSRSGLAIKNAVRVSNEDETVMVFNEPGTIDAGYRGEICVILGNFGREKFLVKKGMKIAQMVIAPVIRPKISLKLQTLGKDEQLSHTARALNGFGSTGMYQKVS